MNEEVMNESWIVPESDFVINMDQWAPGTPLWITGTSGDGKSTMARKLADENDALICPTDVLLVRIGWTKEKWDARIQAGSQLLCDTRAIMAIDYVNQHPEFPYGVKNSNGTWDSEMVKEYMKDYVKWIIVNAKKNPKYKDRKIIVEGCDLCRLNPEFFAKEPLIIIGCSRLQSLFRRIKRDVTKHQNAVKVTFNQLKKYNTHVKFLDDDKEEFRNSVRNIYGRESVDDQLYEEKVHLDTLLTDFKLFTGDITLYHFTHRDLSVISPVTVNIGNKLARPRKSSWWTPYDTQGGWVLLTAIKAFFPEEKWRGYVWTTRTLKINGESVKLPVGAIRKSFYESHKDFIDSYKVYKYTKHFKGTDLGLGTEYSVKEYTCDDDVIPDKKEVLMFHDLRKDIIIADDDEMDKYISEWVDLKQNGKHLQDMVNENRPWLYYDFEDGQNKKAAYQKKHKNVKMYSDNDRKEVKTESVDDGWGKKKNIVDEIESKLKEAGLKYDIEENSKDIFINPDSNKKQDAIDNANTLCIAGMGDSEKAVFAIVKEICDKHSDFKCHEDEYNTIFVTVNKSADFYIDRPYQVIHETGEDDWMNSDEGIELIIEAAGDSHIIRDGLYPMVEKVLSTPKGDRAFKEAVRQYIDRNTDKLHTSGPVYLVPFTDVDKAVFFELFNTTPSEVTAIVSKMTSKVNDKASWKLLKQNPIFCLFYQCIRYYHLHNDKKGINVALAIYALASYPSVFSAIFPYGTNPEVMQYTIDNLTAKFIIKQAGNIFSALVISIQNSYNFLKGHFADASDAEVIRFIARIRNDQKSMLKNVADNFFRNYKLGLRVTTQNETYGDNELVDDALNNTSIVEDTTRKIVLSMLTNGIDTQRVSAAAQFAVVSMTDLRFYLSKIVVSEKSQELSQFVEAILFVFLYQEHHKPYEINESQFLKFALDLFRRTNAGDVNIVTIKNTLDKWSEDTGMVTKFRRLASRVSYKKGIYLYVILCIQYYNA